MQSTIPTSTKRSYTFIAGLDGMGLLIMGSGIFAAIGVLHESWPIYLRIPAILVIGGAATALSWGKWPPGEHGDKVSEWSQRILHYYQEEHKILKYWEGAHPMTPPKSRTNDHRPHTRHFSRRKMGGDNR